MSGMPKRSLLTDWQKLCEARHKLQAYLIEPRGRTAEEASAGSAGEAVRQPRLVIRRPGSGLKAVVSRLLQDHQTPQLRQGPQRTSEILLEETSHCKSSSQRLVDIFKQAAPDRWC